VRRKQWLVVAAFFAFTFVAVNQGGDIARFIADWELGSAETFGAEVPKRIDLAKLSEEERALYERIVAEAPERRIEPIDARVDSVWKAIPGLNGREVDIERTFTLARQQGVDKAIPFLYREIPVGITLEDLGAQPIYKGNPRKPMVSFMINVAWKEENIPAMLDILREEEVKATFFFLGSWLKDPEHMEIATQIAEEGHELANHAYSHKDLSDLTNAQVRKELEETQMLLQEIGVEHNQLFAPPSGDFNENTVRVAHEMGLHTILWTIDTVDWKNPDPNSIVRKIGSRLEPGALILMHPTESARDALQGMIRAAKKKGLAVGTVSNTISPYRALSVETPPGF